MSLLPSSTPSLCLASTPAILAYKNGHNLRVLATFPCPDIYAPLLQKIAVEDMAHKAAMLETQEFLDNFLKGPAQPSEKPPTRKRGFNPFTGLKTAAKMKESKISQLFVKAVNRHSLAPGLKMALSEDRPDKGDDPKQLKVVSAFYRDSFVPTDKRPHWEDHIVAVEFKAHGTANDPYDDRKPESGEVDADAETRKKVRGQIIHYAEQAFEYQHRTSLILLIIIGRRFRFSRWDRSGTIVTPAVDYVKQPLLLCEMLWYMGRLSDEALGLDPTAHRVMPGSEEYTQMLRAKSAPVGLPDIDHAERESATAPPANAIFRYVREMFAKSLDEAFPWYRLEVPDGEKTRSFLVGKPAFCAPGMAGRGTKGFVALEVGSCPPRFVWLKDAWRTQYEFVAQEGAVLKELNDAGVVNVPTLICHGDILEQETQTPTWWEFKNKPSTSELPTSSVSPSPSVATSSRTLVNRQSRSSRGTKRRAADMEDDSDGHEECQLRRHKHYRVVVKEIGMKLVEFRDGQQLLQIMFNCVCAHTEAVTKANIMHRDISGGNILILPKVVSATPAGDLVDVQWTGLLVDWELSKPLKGQAGLPRPRQPERTGTWQFMSAAVLNNHSKQLEIADELESFFHVTLYYAVRYLESNCVDVGAFIEDYFDTFTVKNDKYKCGWFKSTTMTGGTLKISTDDEESLQFQPALDSFFVETLQWFQARYAVEAYRRRQAKQELAKSTILEPKGPTRVARKIVGWGHIQPPPLSVPSKPVRDSVPAPSEEHFALAEKLTTHDGMLNALMAAMAAPWQSKPDRVLGDNVSATFKPKNRVGPPVAGASHKKRKTDPLARAAVEAIAEHPFFSEPPPTPPHGGNVV
ncbi:hypothetical protein ACG7TL_006320 [Trametes sanguinea]